MAMIKLSVETNKLKRTFNRISGELKEDLEQIIPAFLEEVKNFQIQTAPWDSRTGTLERSHKVSQVGELAWELTADPTEFGADYDYAGRLEQDYAGAYSWFYSGWDFMRPELMKKVTNEVRRKLRRVLGSYLSGVQ
jgi:hypothetical protein